MNELDQMIEFEARELLNSCPMNYAYAEHFARYNAPPSVHALGIDAVHEFEDAVREAAWRQVA